MAKKRWSFLINTPNTLRQSQGTKALDHYPIFLMISFSNLKVMDDLSFKENDQP